MKEGPVTVRLPDDLISRLRVESRRKGIGVSEAELERYADEIDALPDISPLLATLWGTRLALRDGPPRRKQ